MYTLAELILWKFLFEDGENDDVVSAGWGRPSFGPAYEKYMMQVPDRIMVTGKFMDL